MGSPLYTKIELYKRKPSVALQWPWLQGHGDDAIPSKIVNHHRYFQQKGVQNQSQKAYVVQGHSLDFPGQFGVRSAGCLVLILAVNRLAQGRFPLSRLYRLHQKKGL